MSTIPKSRWGDGPWQHEPDRAEWRDGVTGLPCLIVRAPSTGALCGYVAVAPGHPAHGKNCSDLDAAVHGGLSYAGCCAGHICHVPQPGESDDVWWLGFDCAHAFDKSPAIDALLVEIGCPRNSSDYDIYRDLAYVRAQCARLAAWLKAMS